MPKYQSHGHFKEKLEQSVPIFFAVEGENWITWVETEEDAEQLVVSDERFYTATWRPVQAGDAGGEYLVGRILPIGLATGW